VMYGANDVAGEGGHTSVDPNGPDCRTHLGHRGCLETVASLNAIFDRLKLPHQSAAETEEAFRELAARAHDDNEETIDALKEAGEALGRFVTSVININDPGRISIYAHWPLADPDQKSAVYFQTAVDEVVAESTTAGDRLERKTDVTWVEIKPHSRAVAAAAIAATHFLHRPYHWAPSLLELTPPGAEVASALAQVS
jgi:predicted NBD/HSP70 family sugar kinase